jgi:hypothetical protein
MRRVTLQISLTWKWLESWEIWVGGQWLKNKTWDIWKDSTLTWWVFKKKICFWSQIEMVPFSFIVQRSKTLIDYVKVKETYDHPMQGIWKCVDGVPKVKLDSPLKEIHWTCSEAITSMINSWSVFEFRYH